MHSEILITVARKQVKQGGHLQCIFHSVDFAEYDVSKVDVSIYVDMYSNE